MAKILYLITKSNWGGAQRYVYDLVTHLPQDLQPIVAAGGDPAGGGAGGLLKQYLREKNIPVIDLPGGRDIALVADFKLLLLLFKIIKREKPEIIHVNSSKLAGLGAFACFCHNIFWKLGIVDWKLHCLFTAHGWPFNEDRNIFARAIMYFFSWLTALFAHTTITLTERDYIQGLRMLGLRKCVRLVRNAISHVDLMPRELARHALTKLITELAGADGSAASSASLSSVSPEFWIGNIAELHKNKGLEYGLRALAELPPSIPWRYMHMGEGEERTILEALSQKLKIDSRVHFVGFVPHASSHLLAFDIFLFPSVKEGLSYTLLEASQAGLPVVASTVGGNPDILGQQAKLVPAKNVKLLTQALTELLENEKERKELGEKLKERAEKEFVFETFLAETYTLYHSP